MSKIPSKSHPGTFFKRLSCSQPPNSYCSSNWHSSGIIHFLLYYHVTSIEVFHIYFILLSLYCCLSSQIKFKLFENQYILSITLKIHLGMKQQKYMANNGSSLYAYKMIDTNKKMILKSK